MALRFVDLVVFWLAVVRGSGSITPAPCGLERWVCTNTSFDDVVASYAHLQIVHTAAECSFAAPEYRVAQTVIDYCKASVCPAPKQA